MAGFHIDGQGWGRPGMRKLGGYALVFVLHGEARYRDAAGTRMVVGEGDLFFLFPDRPHAYTPRAGVRWDEFWITFSGPLFDAWVTSQILDPRRPALRLKESQYWLDRFLALFPPSVEARTLHPLERACRLNEILGEIFVYRDRHALVHEDIRWLEEARRLLDQLLPPQTVARQMNVSYDGFRHRFVTLSGVPPGQYRTRRIIQEAGRRMIREKRTNKQLADDFGFSSEFHFSRCFKQVTGLSPQSYRQTAG